MSGGGAANPFSARGPPAPGGPRPRPWPEHRRRTERRRGPVRARVRGAGRLGRGAERYARERRVPPERALGHRAVHRVGTRPGRDGGGRGGEREPHDLPVGPAGPHAPTLADGTDDGESATGRGQFVVGVQRVRGARLRYAGVVVPDGDREAVEQQLDLDGAPLVRLGVPVDVAQKLGDTEHGMVDEGVELPMSQMRGDNPADLSDPRRQGMKLHRVIPARLADHGCDSPK